MTGSFPFLFGTKYEMKTEMNAPGCPVIEISDLNFHFGAGVLRQQILYDVALTIASGEIVLVTGPSGSGKTTLLTLIGALRSAREGSVKVFGQELRGASRMKLAGVRRDIGFIFQAHNLLASLTAEQNVRMSAELAPDVSTGEVRRRSAEILREVGLGERLAHFPGQLSGGQKQRVAIARALVNRPRLVLADEPTAALDSKTGRDVVDLLQKLARERGTPILMVTHDSRVLDIADRIVRLEDGRIVQRPGEK